MLHLRAIILLSLVAVCSAPSPARAERGNAPREGWVLGLVVGGGSADFSVNDGVSNASSGWDTGGRVLRGRVGRFVTPELLLTAEYGVWRRAAGADSSSTEAAASTEGWTEPVDRYLGTAIMAVNLYPRVEGFSLRAGLGYGRGEATVIRDGATVQGSEKGALILMGVAWERPISQDISIVFGADFGRFEGGTEISGNFAHLTATFQLHLPQGIPSGWF